MPSLNWIGKEAVEHHHRDVPYRLIHCDGDLSAGDPEAGNLLVQGDNLEALKALLPYYGGQVKCIYIDPPYNTGNEGWFYNDNVNSPEMKAWLGKVVGKDSEDLSRHDKWLCMIYPRLRLLRDFLAEDGVIFVSIDDAAHHLLRLCMEEIFGKNQFSTSITWRSSDNSNNDAKGFSQDKNHIVVFSKSADWLPQKILDKAKQSHFKNPTADPRGPYFDGNPLNSPNFRDKLQYNIKTPSGKVIHPPRNGWRWNEITLAQKIASGEIRFSEDETRIIRRTYLADSKGYPPSDLWIDLEKYGHNRAAKYQIQAIFDGDEAFETPKPVSLIQKIFEVCVGPNDLVLDSFAGSGTTGHAVLDLNKQEGGNRRFILVEMDEVIATKITSERLRRVIRGYNKSGDPSKPVPALGGGFRYCRLGTPLFNEFGDIDGAVAFPDLAAHVFFAETGAPIPAKAQAGHPYLGKHGGKAVYLLFAAGQEGTPREALGNVLTPGALAALPPAPEGFSGTRVVYAEGCTVAPDRLKAEGVMFRQIPYHIAGV
jgi:adenine-specific DNA-methyltransferase